MKTMINWFSIPCSDFERAVKFYNAIFDIEMIIAKSPEGDDMAFFFSPEEGLSGAINSDPNLTPNMDGTRIYLNAEGQLNEVIGRVTDAGGEIITPRTSIDEHGSIAVLKDTEGNSIGIHSLS